MVVLCSLKLLIYPYQILLYMLIYTAGTFIDQGEAPDFYFERFPEDHPVLGFFTWRWILNLGFDHMFSSPIFLGTLGLLAASLMACTYTTQIPLVKVARRSILKFELYDFQLKLAA